MANHLNTKIAPPTAQPETGFDAPIREAVKAGNLALAQRMATEKRIVVRLIETILSRGHSVSICEWEEMVCEKCTDKHQILAAMFSTDEDFLNFQNGKDEGTVLLIYGNDGFDVINDYSDNSETRAIMELIEVAMIELI